MSLQRLKRLQRLESRRPAERPWSDPGPAAIALLQWCLESFAAVDAGKACLVPVYGPPERPSEAQDAVMRDLDRLAARLAAERAG